jgi:hypothetical protein
VALPPAAEVLAAARIARAELEGLTEAQRSSGPLSWATGMLTCAAALKAEANPETLPKPLHKLLHDATGKVNRFVIQYAAEKAERDQLVAMAAELQKNSHYFNLLGEWTKETLANPATVPLATLKGAVAYAQRTYARYDREAKEAATPARRPGAPSRRGNAVNRKIRADENRARAARNKSGKKN